MKNLLAAILSCLLSLFVQGQQTFPVNGVYDVQKLYHAFTNANIYVGGQSSGPFKGSLLIYDGKIIAVGQDIAIPEGAIIKDCQGLTIYPSFIDPYAGFNVKRPAKREKGSISSSNDLGNWNPAIHPEFKYELDFPIEQKTKEDWLSCGIGLVAVHKRDGIMRGSGEVFHLGIEHPNEGIISNINPVYLSLNKGSSNHDYPSSHMGAIALLRQTFLDAIWYGENSTIKEINPSLEALQNVTEGLCFFELNHPLTYRNAHNLKSEFNLDMVLIGTGKEYLIRDYLDTGTKLILPINFPKPYDIQDPLDAKMVSLEELKHWELAPYNPKLLKEQGHQVALTRDTIQSGKDFITHLQSLKKTGLSHSDILKMLTYTPSTYLGIAQQTGTLETGKIANFFISTSDIFNPNFKVEEHWNIGQRVYKRSDSRTTLQGNYNLVVDGKDFELILENEKSGTKAELKSSDPSHKWSAKVKSEGDLITLVINQNGALKYHLSGKISLGGSVIDGSGTNDIGEWISWAGIKKRDVKSSTKPISADTTINADTLKSLPEIWFPNKAYGWVELPKSEDFVITNAVIWTCAELGILEGGDVWIENSKIKAIGKDILYPTGLKRFDAKGRHLTPGLIDEHSHIALRGGVNEWARANSAETRMEDSVDPWSIQIYRQLAGGVTSAQLLHGSANPIGGQSAIVKLKWGESAEEMLFKDAQGFIKFALGENVKRSNNSDPKNRFPLTRMGVEQTYIDAFTRAHEYRSSQLRLSKPDSGKKIKNTASAPLARRDLQLDALVEILDQQRFISCHSYVASEILMLLTVADSFGFKVNTFTHILEGYKVAPELAEHGAFGSTFSDWWAYKFEVNDAIPYNAAMMTAAGITVAINSDDAEMGRRLNQEAAKTIKYGGLTEEQALKLVTINPAKMLHIDHRTGSIEVGKDADLVLWSDNPLSVKAHVHKTFIEGIEYFSIDEQMNHQKKIAEERARIVAKMLEDTSSKKRLVTAKTELHYHCDTILEDYINQ